MQVEREVLRDGQRRKGEEYVEIYPWDRDSVGKLAVIPDNVQGPKV